MLGTHKNTQLVTWLVVSGGSVSPHGSATHTHQIQLAMWRVVAQNSAFLCVHGITHKINLNDNGMILVCKSICPFVKSFVLLLVSDILFANFPTLRIRLVGGVEKWKDKKDLVFPYVYLVGGMEKWEGGKLFFFVREKNGRIENIVYINWLLSLLYNI